MKLKNRGPAVDLYRPAGVPGSTFVASRSEIEVAGVLADEQPEDALVLVHDGEARAWPLASWEPPAAVLRKHADIRANNPPAPADTTEES